MFAKESSLIRALTVALLLTLLTPTSPAADAEVRTPDGFGQMILVTTKDWNAVDGWLQRFADGQPVGPRIRIVVGRSGLAWGRGLHPAQKHGPVKKEGDGKSPAGVFSLSQAFGYAAPQDMLSLKMPYVQCTTMVECVDDVKSTHYNSVLNRTNVTTPDWNSSEIMLMKDDEYKMGVVVDHNSAPPKAGGGSCIFMHIWKAPGEGTSGCTAMTLENMDTFIHWLDPKQHPILVQLPEKEYERLKDDWRLPEMPEGKK